jgi:transcription antitermination protein NusB
VTSRREGRELALQALYSADIEAMDGTTALRRIMENFGNGAEPAVDIHSRSYSFAIELVNGVLVNRASIDQTIVEKSKNWSLARMAQVDRNILRLAVFELCYRPDIPKNVTINEAIEVAKKFGADDSPSFINGILDEIASTLPDKE